MALGPPAPSRFRMKAAGVPRLAPPCPCPASRRREEWKDPTALLREVCMVAPRRLLSFTLALLGCLLPAPAADTWPVERGPSREPRPYRYDPRQWAQVPKDFLEDAAACVLYAGNSYLVEPDGTVESTTHEITRLNGRKGVEKLGEYRHITYDPAYQKLTLNEALLHKADGRRVAVAPRHLQLRDVSTDYQVYDHEKQLIISFPDLEV